MAILDKDGKIYRIPSPNPMMKNQEFWDYSKLKLINFNKSKKEIVNIEVPIIQQVPVKQAIVEEPLIPTPPEPIPPDPIPVITTHVNPPVVETDSRLSKLVCLPFVNEGYDKKFTFEAVVLDETGFQYIFWTNIEIPPNSIIYYGRRWWKVYELHKKNNGHIHVCNMSDIQPDLS